MRHIKNSVNQLDAYRVLQGGCRVKLNQNESPYDLPAQLKRAIADQMLTIDWNRYPSLGAPDLLCAISDYTGFSGGILVGNGSNELIQTLFLATADVGDTTLVVTPGFSVYPRVASILGVGIETVPQAADYQFDVDRIISAGKRAKLVFLASPNNPTGTSLTTGEIRAILESCPGWVVVDEAYHEFSGETCVDLLKDYPHLVILRTFSKAFGLAGLRAGYLLADTELAVRLEKAQLPFSLGLFQQVAAGMVLNQARGVEQSVERIVSERQRMWSELNEIPDVSAVPSRANFIFFTLGSRSVTDVFNGLRERGVLVRPIMSRDGREGIRVTVGRPDENRIFLRIFKDTMEEA